MSTQSIHSTDADPSPANPNVQSELSPQELTRLNSLAQEVDIDTITIGDRIRRDFSHVQTLANSIQANGLIQPIVITHDRRLIAGESRIRAHRALGLKTIRAVFRGVLDEAELHILECEENNARKGLTWQERCLSVDRTHRYKSTEAVLRGQKWGVRETGELLKQTKSPIALAIFVAEALHENNEEVWKAENLSDAYRVLCRQREEAALKLVVAQAGQANRPVQKTFVRTDVPAVDIPKVDFFTPSTELFTPGVSGLEVSDEVPGQSTTPLVVPLSQSLLRETGGHNSLAVMQSLGADFCDHIICDPPYAIDMDNLQQSQGGQDVTSVAAEHGVDDNLSLLQNLIPLAYTTLRDKGFLILWCDPTMWMTMTDWCSDVGFAVQRWPLVWHKTSACSNQSASTNFTKNIEFAVVARKGKATLLAQQPSCVYTGGNDIETRLLGHPFAKPAGLWEWLYRATCQRGARVLDPFVGCGSSFLPAVKLGLNPIGIECNEKHYGRCLVNVQSFYHSIDPKVIFT